MNAGRLEPFVDVPSRRSQNVRRNKGIKKRPRDRLDIVEQGSLSRFVQLVPKLHHMTLISVDQHPSAVLKSLA